MLLAGPFHAYAQQHIVSGKITGKEDGAVLQGATVVLKGSTISTSANTDGSYSIRLPDGNGILVFSYIGYTSEEVPVNNRNTIDILLDSKNSILNDVVIVGYGTQKKRDLTGAVSSVKAKDLVISSAPDIGHMLKGKAAGLMVKENSAQPGGGLDLLIRGAGSINASNAPLIVVDGFPISDLQQPESGGRYNAGSQSI